MSFPPNFNSDYFVFCLLALLSAAGFAWWARTFYRVKYFLPVVFSLVFLLVWIGVERAEVMGDRCRMQMQSQVQGFAPTYAREFERMGHSRLTLDTPPDDPTYLALIEAQKRWLSVNPTISDIYTMKQLPDGKIVLMVDSETDYDHDGKYEGEREKRTRIGEVYDAGDNLKKAFATKEAVFDGVPYRDRWGVWVSAYVPLRGPDGKMESILGVDYPASAWLQSIELARYSVLRFTFFLILVLLGLSAIFLFMRREAEKLRLAKLAAEEATRAKSHFLANMSHEIRMPLNAVIGFSNLLRDTELNETQKDYLRTVTDSGEILLAVVNDVLDFSKIEAMQRKIENTDFNLEEAVHAIVKACSLRASERIKIYHEYEDGLPRWFNGDVSAVRQIILNYVSNAIKFTSAGEVRVRVAAVPGGRIKISVSDTGIGIDGDKLDKIFVPFEQADASTTRKYGGTGLGLSICKSLAGLMGGTVGVTSESGKGSTFWAELPLKPCAQQKKNDFAGALKDEAEASILKNRKVLVADDNPVNQKLMGILLGKLGCSHDAALDGKDAVDKILSRRYDACLMDLQMPVMGGLDAAAMVKSREGFGSFPIIALTAVSTPEDRKNCMDAGMSGFLLKPIEPVKLKQVLLECLR